MEERKKIIHLSDLHIGYKSCGQKAVQLANKIIEQENPRENIIVITGDIVEAGVSEEDLEIGRSLIARLREADFIVLLCPGNHDYGNGLANSAKTAEKFRNLFLPQVRAFPQLDIINNIAFIGLDSSEAELHWYDRFFADGELGKEQLAGLDQLLNDARIENLTKVVYLHHHPFDFIPFHELKDKRKLKKIIEHRIDILLFGHLHLGWSYNNAWGIKIVLDGGSSTGKRMSRVFNLGIKHRVINLADFSITEKNYLA
jgi:3',5'-cyclic AMP phosphodiesterase CpdA